MMVGWLSAALLLAALSARADDIRRITLDGKGGVPVPDTVVDEKGAGRIFKVPTPALEIFPTSCKPSRGTIMISPGGGYGRLAIAREGRDVAAMLNEAGWDAAVLLYHVDSKNPDTRKLALADAQQALELLRKRGTEFGLSQTRVAAMGFSAGGHLTVRLAHEAEAAGNKLPFAILMYPAYLEQDGKLLNDVSPSDVPTFLCVGDADVRYYPSSQAYAAACKEKGIRCDYFVGAKAGHGFGLSDKLPEGVREWPARLRSFLDSVSPAP